MKSYKNSEPTPPIMQGVPVPPEWRVPHGSYDQPPFNRWAFQNMRMIARTSDVRRGDRVWDMPSRVSDYDNVAFDLQSGSTTWAQMLNDTYTDATLIWHDDRIICEQYFNGMSPRSQHIVFSMSKSLTSTVAGCLIEDGLLDPSAPVIDYVPGLATTAWNGATVQQVLDMTTGAVFDETYENPKADVWKLDVAMGMRAPDPGESEITIWELIQSLKKTDAAHGSRFAYRSIETEVLSTIMEYASGQQFVPMISERLWAPMGAEEDGFFMADAAGFALSDGGFCGCLRDLTRFGRLMLEDGMRDGTRIIPQSWIDDVRGGNHGLFNDLGREIFPNGRYRNMFWIPDQDRPAHLCLGIHGQHIYVDPERGIVAVKLSSWPTALTEDGFLMHWLKGVDAIIAEQG